MVKNIKGEKMVKNIFVFALLVGAISFMGCSKSTSSDLQTNGSVQSTSVSTVSDSHKTIDDGDFSFDMTATEPDSGSETIVEIRAKDPLVNYRYSLKLTRTSGTGKITLNRFITIGTNYNESSVFNDTADFIFSFSNSGDTYDLEIQVTDYVTGAVLSDVKFDVIVN